MFKVRKKMKSVISALAATTIIGTAITSSITYASNPSNREELQNVFEQVNAFCSTPIIQIITIDDMSTIAEVNEWCERRIKETKDNYQEGVNKINDTDKSGDWKEKRMNNLAGVKDYNLRDIEKQRAKRMAELARSDEQRDSKPIKGKGGLSAREVNRQYQDRVNEVEREFEKDAEEITVSKNSSKHKQIALDSLSKRKNDFLAKASEKREADYEQIRVGFAAELRKKEEKEAAEEEARLARLAKVGKTKEASDSIKEKKQERAGKKNSTEEKNSAAARKPAAETINKKQDVAAARKIRDDSGVTPKQKKEKTQKNKISQREEKKDISIDSERENLPKRESETINQGNQTQASIEAKEDETDIDSVDQSADDQKNNKESSSDKWALSKVRVKVPENIAHIKHEKAKMEQKVKLLHGTAKTVSDIIDHRLIANIEGVGAGEESVEKNIWAKIFGGYSGAKGQISHGQVSAPHKMEASLVGIMVGTDHQPTADLMAGIAVSYIATDTKFTLHKQDDSSQDSQLEKLGMVIGNIYVHNNMSTRFSISSNVSYGRYAISTKDQSMRHQGSVLRVTFKPIYKLLSNKNITILSHLAGSFDRLDIKSFDNKISTPEKLITKQFTINGGMQIMPHFRWKKFLISPELNVDYTYLAWQGDNKFRLRDAVGQLILDDKIEGNHGLKFGLGVSVSAGFGEVNIGAERNIHGDTKTDMGYVKLRVKL